MAMTSRLRQLFVTIGFFPKARLAVNKAWVDLPEEAVARAAALWREQDRFVFGELGMVKARADMMASRNGDEEWLVVVGAITDLELQLARREKRQARTAAERRASDELIALIE